MHKDVIKAYIDTREQNMRNKSLAFFKSKNIDIEEKALGDYGDIALLLTSKEFLNIERKTFNDFVTSYISGHLQDQAFRMNNVSNNYCVIVYGSINDLRQIEYKYPAVKHIKKTSIDKMVCTLEMVYKCPVFFVENEAQYFQKILKIAEIINKKNGETLKTKSNVTLKHRKDINILMQANKIGEKTAILLLKEFKTPENVLNASRKDLLKVKGIGDSTISDIKSLKKAFYEGI